MINFRDSKDQTPSALAVLGIVLLFASGIGSILTYRGVDAKTYVATSKREREAYKGRQVIAKENKTLFDTTVSKYQWTEKEDLVSPAALAVISKRSEEHQLKLVSFRPIKSIETNTLIQLPMQFTVDGSFANVASMLEALEKPESKLAIQQVQFASQEGETDKVSANVNVVAFLGKPEKKKTTTARTTPSTTISRPTTNAKVKAPAKAKP